jgi:DNA end-binding protein Ku
MDLSFPMKVYKANGAEVLSLCLITKNGNKIKQSLLDAVTGETVERSSCDHGYEIAKNQYVTFTDAELDELRVKVKNRVEVSSVAEGSDILDPLMVEKSYWLAPEKGLDNMYCLFRNSLRNLKKVAIARWYQRGRDHLVALEVRGDVIVMHQLYYNNEVRKFDSSINNAPTSGVMVDMLTKALKKVDKPFVHSEYIDTYPAAVHEAAMAKQAGSVVSPQSVTSNILDVADLMATLQNMLNKVTASEQSPATSETVTPAPSKRRSKKAS